MNSLPFISLYSATLFLAYTQHYSCKYLSGRCLPDVHLQTLAIWVGQPQPGLRSARQHRLLSAHLALLQAAQLLAHTETFWYVTPAAIPWLHLSPADQYAVLLEPFATCHYLAAAEALNLLGALPPDYNAYLQQQLARQSRQEMPLEGGTAVWQTITADQWQLCLPPSLPLPLCFHLLQLGDWQPSRSLQLNPLTIAQATERGYSLTHITHLLAEATGHPLPPAQQNQLVAWYRHAHAYQLRTVTLISARQPGQLARILQNGNLRPYIQEQISPRHAIISPAIQPRLHKWAARRHTLLVGAGLRPAPTAFTPTVYQWLGLRLLTALGQLIPLPYSPPHAELDALSAQLSPEQQNQLDALVAQIITSLQEMVNGRDAFFPATDAPDPQFIQQINYALQQQTTLTIHYLPLHAPEPKQHTIEPLRLEQRGQLTYLYAYSHRAEANLTFRLDRITDIVPVNSHL
ncbi:MAG: WYL domain-containing protein [Anaerolineae bacterium]|nr:WYL domain-containing protein [Anaerolineae bacterium]